MRENKEKSMIFKVTFDEKELTQIKLFDDENIIYEKGFHKINQRGEFGAGAEHIKARHLNINKEIDVVVEGEIFVHELYNLGKSLREYSKNFNKPYIDNNGAKLYEWQDKNGVRFRAVVDNRKGGPQLPLAPSYDQIITFYSDRNINQRMEFKNPLVKAHYELIEKEQQILKENKHMENKGQDYER